MIYDSQAASCLSATLGSKHEMMDYRRDGVDTKDVTGCVDIIPRASFCRQTFNNLRVINQYIKWDQQPEVRSPLLVHCSTIAGPVVMDREDIQVGLIELSVSQIVCKHS